MKIKLKGPRRKEYFIQINHKNTRILHRILLPTSFYFYPVKFSKTCDQHTSNPDAKQRRMYNGLMASKFDILSNLDLVTKNGW